MFNCFVARKGHNPAWDGYLGRYELLSPLVILTCQSLVSNAHSWFQGCLAGRVNPLLRVVVKSKSFQNRIRLKRKLNTLFVHCDSWWALWRKGESAKKGKKKWGHQDKGQRSQLSAAKSVTLFRVMFNSFWRILPQATDDSSRDLN